jgi:hypothetical protein
MQGPGEKRSLCPLHPQERTSQRGEELLIMKESDILGVLEGAAASKKKAA